MLWLILWIGIAIWCMNLADKKGYDKTAGFVFGILFGVIALIYYATAKDLTGKSK